MQLLLLPWFLLLFLGFYIYFSGFTLQVYPFSNRDIIQYIFKVPSGYSYIMEKLDVKDERQ